MSKVLLVFAITAMVILAIYSSIGTRTVITEKVIYSISDRENSLNDDDVLVSRLVTGAQLNKDSFADGFNWVDNNIYLVREETILTKHSYRVFLGSDSVELYDDWFKECDTRYYDSSLDYGYYRDQLRNICNCLDEKVN